MIKGTGIDLVSVKRIERTIQRWGLKFILKVFTPGEIEYCEGKEARYQHYAARFAAKEAAVKMLGKTTGIGWKDIEVSHDRDGRPVLLLHGRARLQAERLGIRRVHIAISHEREMAVVQVIGEGD
ncbi:MAG: holo-ACP synthase [Halanaerobiaceae bacterium]|nr:holo-ACP synthase [Halanaerobiaceae bacterium]